MKKEKTVGENFIKQRYPAIIIMGLEDKVFAS
jgi:hypothetical protein